MGFTYLFMLSLRCKIVHMDDLRSACNKCRSERFREVIVISVKKKMILVSDIINIIRSFIILSRYAPLYEESSVSDNQPYTIIIQLPKREEKRRNRYYEKYYDRDDAHDREYTGNEHYNDHDEDFGSRAFHIGEKKVQIKVTEDAGSKVHIKVSRIDDDKGIEIADKNNTTVLTTPIFLSSKLLPTHTAETNLLTFKPPLFFQRHIQGI
uniref:uncharacterized protein LOC127067705 isoform X1 n=1 Tax=Vespula vulgaris TaxID=7454 RepID=UPI002136FAFF|nr:uncharacterized protein LOC127067705 isoform X1 [Vespula vulgaris]